MDSKPSILSKESLIPVGVVVAVVGVVISASFFLSGVNADVRALTIKASDLENDHAAFDLRVRSLEQSKASLDTKMDAVLKSLDEIKSKLNLVK